MEKANGVVKDAAIFLGYETAKELHDVIRNNSVLSIRWGKPKDGTRAGSTEPPGSEAVIHRAPPKESGEEPIPLADDTEAMAAFEKEDAAVKRGLEKMGLPQSAAELAIACQNQQRRHFRTTLESMGGGINRQYWIIMGEIDKINRRLDDSDCAFQEQVVLREDRRALYDIQSKFFDRAMQDALVRAKVYQISNAGKKKTEKSKGYLDLSQ